MLSTYCRAYYTLKILRIARCTICSGSTMLNAMDCPLYSRAHSSPQKVFTESNVTSNRRWPDITKKQYVVLILVPAFLRPHIRVILVIRSDWFFLRLEKVLCPCLQHFLLAFWSEFQDWWLFSFHHMLCYKLPIALCNVWIRCASGNIWTK